MKTKIIYLIALIFFYGSCTESFLEQENPNKQTFDNYWKTENDLKSAIATTYWAATMTWAGYGDLGWFRREFMTEAFGVQTWGWMEQTFTYTETPGGDIVKNYWPYHYRGINYCNQIIKYGAEIDIDESIKAQYIAEAKFMRGLFYWFLVTDWGVVPLRLTPAESEADYEIEKSTEVQVWAQIEKDLSEAAAGLPDTRPSTDYGRAIKGTALAYLGRVYLYQNKWSDAQTTLKSIVDNASTYHYGLLSEYEWLFDGNHENEVNGVIEGVFEIQRSNLGGSDRWADYGERSLSTKRGTINSPVGWNYLIPTQALLDSFLVEPAVVPDADGNYFDPRATATLAWNYDGCKLYQKDYQSNWGKDIVYGKPRICNKKFANWWSTGEDENSFIDEYGMRYADVLLMLAEAYTMNGNVSDAADLVHQIRDRANLADKKTVMKSWSQSQMLGEIKRQRLLEFANEGLYFYDLRRWGMLADKIANSYNPYKASYSSKHDYYPIPQTELDNNPKMTQNDAWE